MIRRNTWVLLFILAGLIGLTFYLKNQQTRAEAEATPTAGISYLFTSAEGLPSGIKIEAATGESVEVTREANGKWVLKAPVQAEADQGLIEAAATQVGSLRVLGQVEIGLDIVGLDRPSYHITITFTGGKEHKMEVGSVTPTNSGYYVTLDGGKVTIVSKTSLDALLNLLTSPPYAETPTPSAVPTTTESALQTPSLTPTGVSVTSTPTP